MNRNIQQQAEANIIANMLIILALATVCLIILNS